MVWSPHLPSGSKKPNNCRLYKRKTLLYVTGNGVVVSLTHFFQSPLSLGVIERVNGLYGTVRWRKNKTLMSILLQSEHWFSACPALLKPLVASNAAEGVTKNAKDQRVLKKIWFRGTKCAGVSDTTTTTYLLVFIYYSAITMVCS